MRWRVLEYAETDGGVNRKVFSKSVYEKLAANFLTPRELIHCHCALNIHAPRAQHGYS